MNSRISDVKIEWGWFTRHGDNVYTVFYVVDNEPPARYTKYIATNELHAFQRFTEFANKAYPNNVREGVMNSRISNVRVEWRYSNTYGKATYTITYRVDNQQNCHIDCHAKDELAAYAAFMKYANRKFPEKESNEQSNK
jgi:hypothetical protein